MGQGERFTNPIGQLLIDKGFDGHMKGKRVDTAYSTRIDLFLQYMLQNF